MLADPCIALGDWNTGATLSGPRTMYYKLLKSFEALGFKSLYHHIKQEEQGKETSPTLKFNKGGVFHVIDHMQASDFFVKRAQGFHVENFAKVPKSDHAPLIFDFDPFKKVA